MAKATPASLTEKERALIKETERAHLQTLDEAGRRSATRVERAGLD